MYIVLFSMYQLKKAIIKHLRTSLFKRAIFVEIMVFLLFTIFPFIRHNNRQYSHALTLTQEEKKEIDNGPNTAQGSIYVMFPQIRTSRTPYVDVRLYNALKRETTIKSTIGQFSFNNLSSGEYFIHIYDLMYYDHPIAVSLGDNETKSINIPVNAGTALQRYSTVPTLILVDPTTGEIITPRTPEPIYYPPDIDSQYPVISGTTVLTVCEYLKMRADYPVAYMQFPVILIGNLVKTPDGSWLRQSCGNPVKSGTHVWPDTIFLDDSNVESEAIVNNPNNQNSRVLKEAVTLYGKAFIHNNSDNDGNAVAVIGRLRTSYNLVYAKCGEEKTCGFGYGPIAAPAQIEYWQMRYLNIE